MRIIPIAYLASYTLSLLGNAIAGIALPLIILQATGSALSAGIVASASAIPAVIAGLFAGVVIDRINRRTSSAIADLVSAISVGALPVVDSISGLSLGWFIALGIIGSIGDVPGRTAREALLPAIVRSGGVSAERLVGIREGLGALTMLVGPAVAGALLMWLNGSAIFWVTAATSLAAAMLTLCIPHRAGALVHPLDSQAQREGTTWQRLRGGWRVMFTDRFLRSVTLLGLASATVITGLQGLILPVHFTLSDEPGMLGFVLSAMAAGMMLGAGIYAALGTRGNRRAWFAIGVGGVLLGFLSMASLAATWLIFAGAFVVGLSSGLFSSLLGVLLIERTPEHMRGRIMGTQNAMMTAAPAIGIMLAASLTELVTLRLAAFCIASIWLFAAIAALITPALRDLGPSAPRSASSTGARLGQREPTDERDPTDETTAPERSHGLGE